MKKADEYKQCWKDISTLRMDLLEGLAEYMSIHNKAEILAPAYSKPPAQYPAQPLAVLPQLGATLKTAELSRRISVSPAQNVLISISQ